MFNKLVLSTLIALIAAFSFSQSALAMRQPAMENSMRALDNAERILKKAIPNKGGHRAKALMHIRKARQEIRKGIDFANRRPAGGQLKSKKGFREPSHPEQRSKFSRDRDEKMMKRDRNQQFRDKAAIQREKAYRSCLKRFRGNSRRIRECERNHREGNEHREERREKR